MNCHPERPQRSEGRRRICGCFYRCAIAKPKNSK